EPLEQRQSTCLRTIEIMTAAVGTDRLCHIDASNVTDFNPAITALCLSACEHALSQPSVVGVCCSVDERRSNAQRAANGMGARGQIGIRRSPVGQPLPWAK